MMIYHAWIKELELPSAIIFPANQYLCKRNSRGSFQWHDIQKKRQKYGKKESKKYLKILK